MEFLWYLLKECVCGGRKDEEEEEDEAKGGRDRLLKLSDGASSIVADISEDTFLVIIKRTKVTLRRNNEERTGPDLFQRLPDEVLVEIFSYLSQDDLARGVRFVCRRFYHISRSVHLVRRLELPSGSRRDAHFDNILPDLREISKYRLLRVLVVGQGEHFVMSKESAFVLVEAASEACPLLEDLHLRVDNVTLNLMASAAKIERLAKLELMAYSFWQAEPWHAFVALEPALPMLEEIRIRQLGAGEIAMIDGESLARVAVHCDRLKLMAVHVTDPFGPLVKAKGLQAAVEHAAEFQIGLRMLKEKRSEQLVYFRTNVIRNAVYM